MASDNCRACGAALEPGAVRCPHCGERSGAPLSRLWILTFFVLGVVIGLLLLVLQGGQLPPATGFRLPWSGAASGEATAPPAPAPIRARPQAVTRAPMSAAQSDGRVVVAPMRCDRKAARQVQEKARELATLSVQGGGLLLQLGAGWEYYSPGLRRSFVETFAAADHCLLGDGRSIRFTFRGAEVAEVTAEGAVRMR
jgi:hypothetical protein